VTTQSGSRGDSSAPEAEDVVHDVTVYLLEKRDDLTAIPGKAYFLTAVRNGALRWLLYAWSRRTVVMDHPEDHPENLVANESREG